MCAKELVWGLQGDMQHWGQDIGYYWGCWGALIVGGILLAVGSWTYNAKGTYLDIGGYPLVIGEASGLGPSICLRPALAPVYAV